MNGNDFVKFMLRSPLHVFMGNTMIITVTGRKTGRKISTPVSYFRNGDTLWVLTTRTRTWWRNVKQGAEVILHLHGRDMRGFADVILDERAVAARLVDYVGHIPLSAGSLGIRLQNGVPDADDAVRVAKERLFVRVCL
jgi:hypothetical protein